jgi:hypothetical protein
VLVARIITEAVSWAAPSFERFPAGCTTRGNLRPALLFEFAIRRELRIMIALISTRIRREGERSFPLERFGRANFWQKAWHAFVDWLTEPISFPGKWPECNPSEQRYNEDKEAMIQSSKESLADVR